MTGRLFIAEKPSVARAIADVLGSKAERHEGFIKVGQDVITWVYGHVLALYDPSDYDLKYKVWRIEDLPIIPAEWKMKAVDNEGSKLQIKVITALSKKFDTIINCGDPDREGQLLVDELLEYVDVLDDASKKILRVLPNATDPASIKRALSEVEPNSKYRNLYHAGKGRAYNDWLIGMNLSRAATKFLMAEKGFISIGRVQTPVLGLVTTRCETIENFKSRDFWKISATAQSINGVVTLENNEKDEEKRIWDQQVAKDIVDRLKGASVILTVKTELKKRRPPDLYTLQSLQKDTSKYWKWGAKQTVDIAQSLYDAKLLSYPRTECAYLPAEQKIYAPTLIDIILGTGEFDKVLPLKHLMAPNDSVYDSSKVEEHHALVPTTIKPDLSTLSPQQVKLWKLVAHRFLCSTLPSYQYKLTSISFIDEPTGLLFKTEGEIPVNFEESWQAISNKPKKVVILPDIKDGDRANIIEMDLAKGATTPPSYYTEGTLIADMGAVSKYVNNPKYKAILKDTSGIGTAATQASIIETLKARAFIYINSENYIQDTEFGRAIIKGIPSALYDPGLTAIVEDALKDVQHGNLSLEDFMKKAEVFLGKRLQEIKELKGKVFIVKPEGVTQHAVDKSRKSQSANSKNKEKAKASSPKKKRQT